MSLGRAYKNNLDEIADPSKPLIRRKVVYSEGPGERRSTIVRSASPKRRSKSPSIVSEKDRSIKRLNNDVDTLNKKNSDLRKEARLRQKNIDALEDLLERERDALQEVLDAARTRMRELQEANQKMADELGDEREKRIHLEEDLVTMDTNHRLQMQVVEKHIHDLRAAVKEANDLRVAAAKKHAEDMDTQRAHYETMIATLREQMAAAEQRFDAEKNALTMANERLKSMMRIWQEIIADLRMRLKRMDGWIYGFRLWHSNVMYDIENAVQEIELNSQPQLDALDVDGWDIKALAAREFGL